MTNSPSLFVALTVVLELEWVLRAFYRFEPAQIVRALGHLLGKIVEHVRERVASVLT
jgi:predicted nucleic-acid-binding protein